MAATAPDKQSLRLAERNAKIVCQTKQQKLSTGFTRFNKMKTKLGRVDSQSCAILSILSI
ncbi:MAG: hypothetical protein SF097_19575 [Acidobacteriota bacterium]|nr:hypothetical protein [Acidobacteriota bacterium]